ncbi:MAG TPA: hypothetical protein VLQ93_05325 [Myxococcaceae bacterium]|nr:hypothetical protein [Myxococcaceae bacterium]
MLKVPTLVVGALAIMLSAGVLVKRAEPPAPASVPVAASEQRTASALPMSFEAIPTFQAGFVHEVAIPWKPSESEDGGEGAVPAPGISTPVPTTTMTAMVQKLEEKKATPKKRGLRSLGKKLCVGAACCATLAGCPAPQIRPTPQPEACPPGAVETMKELGISLGAEHGATFPAELPPEIITVEEGFTSIKLIGPWKELPSSTVFRGRLLIGEDRVFGRFTEAETPTGTSYPVCLELRDRRGGRGIRRKADGGPDRARIFSTVDVRAVDRFE